MNSLPPELWAQVFQHLAVPSLQSFSLVSRAFNDIVQPELFRVVKFFLSEPGIDNDTSPLPVTQLHIWDSQNTPPPPPRIPRTFPPHLLPHVRKLFLDFPDNLNHDESNQLLGLPSFKALQAVHVQYPGKSWNELDPQIRESLEGVFHLPGLKEVAFTKWADLSNPGINSFAPSVDSLVVSGLLPESLNQDPASSVPLRALTILGSSTDYPNHANTGYLLCEDFVWSSTISRREEPTGSQVQISLNLRNLRSLSICNHWSNPDEFDATLKACAGSLEELVVRHLDCTHLPNLSQLTRLKRLILGPAVTIWNLTEKPCGPTDLAVILKTTSPTLEELSVNMWQHAHEATAPPVIRDWVFLRAAFRAKPRCKVTLSMSDEWVGLLRVVDVKGRYEVMSHTCGTRQSWCFCHRDGHVYVRLP